jgi:hypothetical protein
MFASLPLQLYGRRTSEKLYTNFCFCFRLLILHQPFFLFAPKYVSQFPSPVAREKAEIEAEIDFPNSQLVASFCIPKNIRSMGNKYDRI